MIAVATWLYGDDADALSQRAGKAGGEVLRPPQDPFYGERSGTVRKLSGHESDIGHDIAEVEEKQRRFGAIFEE